MLNQILALSKELISIRSISENPRGLEESLELALSPLKGYTIERFEKNGSKSALIYNSEKRPDRFKIILNGHLDVVPGKEHQYSPKIENDRLYGVGALDMKTNAATLITVFSEVANKVDYPLGLQLVTDEELGGFNGTKYQIDEGVRADFVIAGETTNFDIAYKAKGILWLRISCKGKSAHGAYPWRGKNAIWKMNAFLNALEKAYPALDSEKWATTVNLSRIETTNKAFNKIPDDCEVNLDIRYVPEESDTIEKKIKALLPEEFTCETIVNEPSLLVDESNSYIKMLQSISERITKKKVVLYGAQGSSDARHYALVGCDGIEFGPIGGNIGSDDEWISIPSIETYYQILEDFLLSMKS